MTDKRHPLPPFTVETAKEKVQLKENTWNTKDAEEVSKTYTIDTKWRNRNTFLNGREEVIEFLNQKWEKELNYKLKKELWCFDEDRIAVRFEYEWYDNVGQRECKINCVKS